MSLIRTMVVAPHPDDELLGCGGTLLRRKGEGAELGWLIVTGISEEMGWSREQVQQREKEIAQVQTGLRVDQLYNLRLRTTKLYTIPMGRTDPTVRLGNSKYLKGNNTCLSN